MRLIHSCRRAAMPVFCCECVATAGFDTCNTENRWRLLISAFFPARLPFRHVAMLGLIKLNPESWLRYRSKRCVTHFDNFASYYSLMLSITL